ncbi:hypothetical protein [Cruoricaptor ignavus]|nr:hypothetical protein [Cruoricaptor ignavus]
MGTAANAQLQQGNWTVGSDLVNMRFTNGFALSLQPRAAYFIQDRWAVGAHVGVDVQKVNGESDTQTNWEIAPFTRYYFTSSQIDSMLRNGAFFGEALIGVGGVNSSGGDTTNGFVYGIGAGYSYFITENVSVEGLLKFRGITGGGNDSDNNDVFLGVGFSIYLPSAKVRQVANDRQ